MEFDRRVQEAIKGGKKYLCQRQRQNKGDHCRQDRFAQELDRNLVPRRAHYLAQRNLTRSHHRPGCSQIGEIETGH